MSSTTSAHDERAATSGSQQASGPSSILDQAYKKATWRLIPFIFVCYFFNYLDRVNVGFAKLEMLDALKLPAAFLGSAAAAGGLALINSLGQVAGFVSPFLVGWIKDFTGSTDVALYILSSVLLVGALIVLRVPARLVNR